MSISIDKTIIAEIGSVHDGSFGNALKLIELAGRCGANAVKFQTHIADAETTKNAPNPAYFSAENRYEYFLRTGFSIEQWRQLKDFAESLNLSFLSSPFSLEAVDLLENIGIKAYKIPSGEISNHPLLEKIAKIGKPVILSSGMSNWTELDAAVSIFKEKCKLVVMQCTSEYPCPMNNVGINVIQEIHERYRCSVGFSDHTLGYAAPIAAATLGASVIEKHLTFSRGMYGSDAQHSMEPSEFTLLCKEIKDVWTILDNPVDKGSNSKYSEMKAVFEKSIVASKNIGKGAALTYEDIAFKKAGKGMPAKDWGLIVGLKAIRDIAENEKLGVDDFAR